MLFTGTKNNFGSLYFTAYRCSPMLTIKQFNFEARFRIEMHF